MSDNYQDFHIHCAIGTFQKSESGADTAMRIGGIVSTDDVDQQDETVLQEGLDFGPFLERGWYNDNHGQQTVDVVGYPVNAFYVTAGTRLPNGQKADRAGWWTDGYLLDTERGRSLWQLTKSLNGTPRQLGFSIEGKVLQRTNRGKTVAAAVVKNVAITHCPVNTQTTLHALVKALTAGSAINNPGASPGQGFPLRGESMDRKVVDTHREEDDDTEITKAEKVEGFIIEPMSEMEYAQRFLPALHAAHALPDRVSKSEARALARIRRPDLTDAQIDQLINNLL